MYHTLAKLTFGGGETFFLGVQKAPGGTKKLQGAPESTRGCKKPIKKIVATFFFFFF